MPNKMSLVYCVLSLALLTGCPEAPNWSRVVALRFSNEPWSSVTLSVNSADVQQAVSIIDQALSSRGFCRVTNAPEVGVTGFIAAYSQVRKDRPCLGEPYIWLIGDHLDVSFAEGRIRDHPYSTDSKLTADFLGDVLRKHYGSAVRVTHRSL